MAKPTVPEKIPGAGVPARFFDAVDAVAKVDLGATDAVGEALAEQVRTLSALYTQRRDAIGEDDRTGLVAARLRFFLPRDLPKAMRPVAELHRAGRLPASRTWRVLDLGAGLGATSLGVARYARAADAADALEVTAVDVWERGLEIFESLVAALPNEDFASVRLKTRIGRLDAPIAGGPFDLVLLGLSLNEWARGRSAEDAAALLERLAARLSPGGALLVIEPALRTESRFLQRTRDALAARGGALAIFAPCVSHAPCPMLASERDWCHAELEGELEAPLAATARRAGLRRSRRTFAYLTLIAGEEPDRDAQYRVVSEVLASKGKHEVFVCGRGALVRLRLMKRDQRERNEVLADLRRGDLVRIDRELPRETGAFRLGPDDALRRSR